MTAPSAKSLFRATKPKRTPHPAQVLIEGLPVQRKPDAPRDALDFDPTPPSATWSFLAAEADHIRRHGNVVWENSVGDGRIAGVLESAGFSVIGSDIVDRGWPGTIVRDFYRWDGLRANFGLPPAGVVIGNPPYNEINARDGRGRWLQHSLGLGLRYVAYLLNADWPAARINGMDAILEVHPPSIEYLCTWKIDFRGGGSPPQRNSWFVWDVNRPAIAPNTWPRTRLYRRDGAVQEVLL